MCTLLHKVPQPSCWFDDWWWFVWRPGRKLQLQYKDSTYMEITPPLKSSWPTNETKRRLSCVLFPAETGFISTFLLCALCNKIAIRTQPRALFQSPSLEPIREQLRSLLLLRQVGHNACWRLPFGWGKKGACEESRHQNSNINERSVDKNQTQMGDNSFVLSPGAH